MNQPKQRRHKKLIKPRLQLRLIGTFGGIAVLAMLLQSLMLGYFLMQAVAKLDNGGLLASQVPGTLVSVVGVSLLALTPLFLVLGVMLTFRIAGPVYRFENYLLGVARGEETRPCTLREGDQLQSLCEAINLATEPLRAERAESASESGLRSVHTPAA